MYIDTTLFIIYMIIAFCVGALLMWFAVLLEDQKRMEREFDRMQIAAIIDNKEKKWW